MSNKRVKRVHISGWLEVFLTDTIMARIAHYLTTPTLFQLLLGVNKELRKRATRSKRWNDSMEYAKRIEERFGLVFGKNADNLLAHLMKRLRSKTCCSFCFLASGVPHAVRTRIDSSCLKCCYDCGLKRNLIVSWEDIAEVYVREPWMYAELPNALVWKNELPTLRLRIYTLNELHFLPVISAAKGSIFVIDWNGIARCAKKLN